MNFLNKLKDVFFWILKKLVVVLVILGLLLLVKWKIDSLYISSLTSKETTFSILDEFQLIKGQIKNKLGMQEEIAIELPIVEELEKIDEEEKPTTINIPEGAELDDIANVLIDNELITSKETLLNMIDEMGLKNSFSAGTFEIPKNTKARDILLILANTNQKEVEIEIPDGSSTLDVANILKEKELIQSPETFVKNVTDLGYEGKILPGKHKLLMPLKVEKIIQALCQENK